MCCESADVIHANGCLRRRMLHVLSLLRAAQGKLLLYDLPARVQRACVCSRSLEGPDPDRSTPGIELLYIRES